LREGGKAAASDHVDGVRSYEDRKRDARPEGLVKQALGSALPTKQSRKVLEDLLSATGTSRHTAPLVPIVSRCARLPAVRTCGTPRTETLRCCRSPLPSGVRCCPRRDADTYR